MNKKTYKGKLPTGTPSLAWSTVVVVASLLAGASVVHNIYKPDLSLPPLDNGEEVAKKETPPRRVKSGRPPRPTKQINLNEESYQGSPLPPPPPPSFRVPLLKFVVSGN
ncbi:unnamed protein product [Arabis nemorensis]|uniref:Uncharacterized protein n=1 Tax=Arabis nemorensis TaxID=586526 RepID=A0A565CRS4_9BRAS|nr:unnamed protein product [Arabis nemorensis]